MKRGMEKRRKRKEERGRKKEEGGKGREESREEGGERGKGKRRRRNRREKEKGSVLPRVGNLGQLPAFYCSFWGNCCTPAPGAPSLGTACCWGRQPSSVLSHGSTWPCMDRPELSRCPIPAVGLSVLPSHPPCTKLFSISY